MVIIQVLPLTVYRAVVTEQTAIFRNFVCIPSARYLPGTDFFHREHRSQAILPTPHTTLPNPRSEFQNEIENVS